MFASPAKGEGVKQTSVALQRSDGALNTLETLDWGSRSP